MQFHLSMHVLEQKQKHLLTSFSKVFTYAMIILQMMKYLDHCMHVHNITFFSEFAKCNINIYTVMCTQQST